MSENTMSQLERLKAGDIMTTPVVMIRSHDTMQKAASVFLEKNISGAPVLDKRLKAVGVLTKTDITRYERDKIASWDALSARAPIRTLGTLELIAQSIGAVGQKDCVSEWMTPKVIAVPKKAPFKKVVRDMISKRIHRLFVVEKKNRILGVITTFDLIKFLDGRGDTSHQNKQGE